MLFICVFAPENKSIEITFSTCSLPVDPFHVFSQGLVRILLKFYWNITNILGLWSFQHMHIAVAVYDFFSFSKSLQVLILRKFTCI